MRCALALFALSLCGCSSILGLDDFKDAPASGGGSGGQSGAGGIMSGGAGGVAGGGGSTGGSGGSTGGSGGSTGGSGGSTGGAGGTTATWKCDPEGTGPFTLLDKTDFGTDVLDEHIVGVHGTGIGHIGVAAHGTGSADYHFYVRSIKSGSSSALGSFGSHAATSRFRYFDGRSAASSSVTFWGLIGDELSLLTFPLQSDGVGPTATSTPVAMPPSCIGAQIDQIAWSTETIADQTPAFACSKGGTFSLWMTLAGALTMIDETTNSADSKKMEPSSYAVAGDVHFLMMKDGYFRYGKSASELKAVHQFKPSGDPNYLSYGLYAVSLLGAPPAGVALMVGSIKNDFTTGTFFAGATNSSKYPTLDQTPLPGLASVYTFVSSKQLGVFERRSVDADSILGAAVNTGKTSVRVSHISRDGTVNVFSQEVYAAPSGKLVLSAAAVQAGFYDVVSWIEKDTATNDLSVRALRLSCGP